MKVEGDQIATGGKRVMGLPRQKLKGRKTTGKYETLGFIYIGLDHFILFISSKPHTKHLQGRVLN